ncbi:MAG: sulfotransferase domain-containing protein, partial [Rubrobacteraceae bacterium]
IHIIRDGRDVAVSLMNHFWRMAKDNGGIFELEPEELAKRDAYLADPAGFVDSGNSIFAEERLRQMAVRWSRRVTKASHDGRKLFGSAYQQLRYEDLLENPETHLKSLFGLLGAQTDDALVKYCVDQNRFEKLAKRSKGEEDAASFFRKGVAGDWRGRSLPPGTERSTKAWLEKPCEG